MNRNTTKTSANAVYLAPLTSELQGVSRPQ